MEDRSTVDHGGLSAKTSDIAERLKRLTAIVAAITTLLASFTALVVAAKAGWSEVGPYFGNLVRHGQVEISSKPADGQDAARVDAIDPALFTSLESEDSNKRHRARAALANAVAYAAPSSVDALIGRMEHAPSYRTKLGIAVALRTAPGGWKASDPAVADARLRALTAQAKDATLRSELEGASRARRP